MTDGSSTPKPPEVGGAVMIDGLPAGPEGARVVRAESDSLVLVGRGVAQHSGREVSLLYNDGPSPARVDVRLLGPAGSGDNQVRAAILCAPRSVERRRAERVPIRMVARLSDGVDHTMATVTENASSWGALMRSREALEPGSDHIVELGVNGESIDVQARVVRCDEVGHGELRWRIALAFAQPVWGLAPRAREADREVADGG